VRGGFFLLDSPRVSPLFFLLRLRFRRSNPIEHAETIEEVRAEVTVPDLCPPLFFFPFFLSLALVGVEE